MDIFRLLSSILKRSLAFFNSSESLSSSIRIVSTITYITFNKILKLICHKSQRKSNRITKLREEVNMAKNYDFEGCITVFSSFYLRSVLSAKETAGFLSAVEAAIPFLEKSYSLKVTSKRNTPLCCIPQNLNIIQTIYQIINLHTLFPCLIVLQMW